MVLESATGPGRDHGAGSVLKSHLLVPDARERPSWEPPAADAMIAALGMALTVVGTTNLLLLWLPPQFGVRQWEFTTIGAHLDGMPLFVIGIFLIAIAAVRLALRRPTLAIGVGCVLLALGHAGMMLLYLRGVPYATTGATEAVLPTLRLAIFKAGVLGVTYVSLFGWIGRYLLREVRRAPH
jgi:hypothetical protein